MVIHNVLHVLYHLSLVMQKKGFRVLRQSDEDDMENNKK
jgi:hypothetical protein